MRTSDLVSVILKGKDKTIWSIAPTATVYDALVTMADHQIGSLLVVEGNKILGLLSERDYARKIILLGRSSKDTRVEEIMVSPPITIAPRCSIEEAMRIMTDNRVRHLPVIGQDGEALGIISLGDVVKWVIAEQDATIEHLQNYIAGKS
jgi:CBS domain-containing protein